MKKKQVKAVRLLLKAKRCAVPWMDKDAAELACAIVNLGIARLDGGDLVLASAEKAECWLSGKE